jgi:hypothetical protein
MIYHYFLGRTPGNLPFFSSSRFFNQFDQPAKDGLIYSQKISTMSPKTDWTQVLLFLTGQELDSGKAISFVAMFNLIEWYNDL